MTVDCMREQLLEGKKIRLGDLGDFSILLSSKGAEFKNLIADPNRRILPLSLGISTLLTGFGR